MEPFWGWPIVLAASLAGVAVCTVILGRRTDWFGLRPRPEPVQPAGDLLAETIKRHKLQEKTEWEREYRRLLDIYFPVPPDPDWMEYEVVEEMFWDGSVAVQHRSPIYPELGDHIVRDYQEQLKQMGLYPGPIDGIMGPALWDAMKRANIVGSARP